MSSEILNLEPKRLWYYFNEICRRPHGTGNEGALREYIISVAENLKLKYKTDAIGNVVITKSASNGCKSAKPIILQSHLDMVCESDKSSHHDFTQDPIIPKIDSGWVTSGTTTLGSDNGIGIAASLALLEDKSLQHGPVECLFTMTEETGMDGAIGLKQDLVEGRTMINLDSEDEGLLFVGCAGGGDTIINYPVVKKPLPKDFIGLNISVSGLRGGHSGLNIHEQRGNAIKILGRILFHLYRTTDTFLCDINAGSRRNVIPNFAEVTVAIKKHKRAKAVTLVEEEASKIAKELKPVDPDLKVAIKDVNAAESFGNRPSGKLFALLHAAPHGVIAMSYEIQGLVQTSVNLAVTKIDGDNVSIQFLSRSSSASELANLKSRLAACAELLSATTEEPGGYPGWHPNLNSKILAILKKSYKEVSGVDARHAAIHAGLECGIIGEKFPDMDMVSFGPEIKGAHSVNEKVQIKSVELFYKVLIKAVENFAEN